MIENDENEFATDLFKDSENLNGFTFSIDNSNNFDSVDNFQYDVRITVDYANECPYTDMIKSKDCSQQGLGYILGINMQFLLYIFNDFQDFLFG